MSKSNIGDLTNFHFTVFSEVSLGDNESKQTNQFDIRCSSIGEVEKDFIPSQRYLHICSQDNELSSKSSVKVVYQIKIPATQGGRLLFCRFT